MSYWQRFRENAWAGWDYFKRPTTWYIRAVLILALPVAPIVWAVLAIPSKDTPS